MKKVFTIALLMAFSQLQAQKKTVKLSEIKIDVPYISGNYSKRIDLEQKDTTRLVYIGFQDANYTAITSIASIGLANQEELVAFISDLKAAILEMGKSDMVWDRGSYKLRSMENNSKYVYLYEPVRSGNGWTFLNKKQTEKVLAWLSTIDMERDEPIPPSQSPQ